jgi:hypothetical protein
MDFGVVVMNNVTLGAEIVFTCELISLKEEVVIVVLPSVLVVHEFLEGELVFLFLLNELGHLVFSLDFFHCRDLSGYCVFSVYLNVLVLIVEVGKLVNVT